MRLLEGGYVIEIARGVGVLCMRKVHWSSILT